LILYLGTEKGAASGTKRAFTKAAGKMGFATDTAKDGGATMIYTLASGRTANDTAKAK
jgi:hypothetical protein